VPPLATGAIGSSSSSRSLALYDEQRSLENGYFMDGECEVLKSI